MSVGVRWTPCAVSLCAALALGGCAIAPGDDLLGSSAVVAQNPRETGAVIEVAKFSGERAGEALPAGWEPYIILPSKPRTEYRLVENDRHVVLRAQARASASGLVRVLRADPRRHRALEWRWRVPAPIAGADPRSAAREDAAARVFVSFHGDAERIDFGERARLRLARAMSGQALPYATLMYIWSDVLPPETVVANPHTDRIRMIVVDGPAGGANRWTHMRRDILADYRRAFGEDPWDIVAIGVMTDADNTRSEAQAYYGDITLRVAP